MMIIIWSDFSTSMLKEIYEYYKAEIITRVADRIRKNIFSATKQLIEHPNSGQIEPILKSLNEGHRYLINNNYKIIYKLVEEGDIDNRCI